MDRRNILHAGLFVLSGCTGYRSLPRNQQSVTHEVEESTDSSTNSTNSHSEGQKIGTFRVHDVAVAEKSLLSLTVKFLNEVATTINPAKLRLTTKNISDSVVKLPENPDMPNPLRSDDDTPGLVLLPPNHGYKSASSTCWKLKEGERLGGAGLAPNTKIEPGSSVTLDYVIWSDDRTSGCLKPGIYDFTFWPTQQYATTISVEILE